MAWGGGGSWWSATQPKGGRSDHAVPAATAERVVELAMSPPPAGRSRWTTRLLAKEVGLTSGCVSDLLRRNRLKPHHVSTYTVSRDPDFVAKVRDIVGLYLQSGGGVFSAFSANSPCLTDFPSKKALCDHLHAYMRAWKKNPTPFAWTKPAHAIIRSHRRMVERISAAVQ